jgi:DNA-directed RNA polymerase subunit RPC12/RpoP
LRNGEYKKVEEVVREVPLGPPETRADQTCPFCEKKYSIWQTDSCSLECEDCGSKLFLRNKKLQTEEETLRVNGQ